MEEADLGISCLWNLRQPHSPGSALARPPLHELSRKATGAGVLPAQRRPRSTRLRGALVTPDSSAGPSAVPGQATRGLRCRGVAAGGTWGERSFRPPCATLSARQAAGASSAEATALGAPGLPPAPRDPERVVSLGHGQGVGWEGVCLSCHAPASLGEHWKNAQGTHSLASASIPHRLPACHLCSHGRV